MAVYYNHNVQFENGPFQSPGLYHSWMSVPSAAGPPQDSSVYTNGPTGTTQSGSHTESGYTVFVKVLSPKNKRDYHQHTLRNISPRIITTPEALKEEVSVQVGEAVSRLLDFPIGYYRDSKKIWIQNQKDLRDAWQLLEQNKSLTLWCHGADGKRKRAGQESDESDDSSDSGISRKGSTKKKGGRNKSSARSRLSSDEKAAQVQKLKTKLEQRHGTKFNSCQYRLWAEMVFSGIHESMEEPPQVPMFGAQRKRASPRGGSPDGNLSNALTGVAAAIRDVLSPQPNRISLSSPSKAVDLRSKYLQQLKDVLSLHDMGGLTDEEYEEERSTIVRQMRKLQRDD